VKIIFNSKRKLPYIRKAHYLVSVVIFVGTFSTIGLIAQLTSHAATSSGKIIGINSMCIDNYNNLAKDSNKIQLWACNGGASQVWTVNGVSATSGTIVNGNGYCIGISGGNTANYTDAILYQCDGNTSQQWYYNNTSGEIVNKDSQTCLDDSHSGTANGTQIDIVGCKGTAAQDWTYYVASNPTCPSGDSGTYPNCVAPKPNPTPTPTPTPNPKPNPTPTPTPTPNPKPNPTPTPTPNPTPTTSGSSSGKTTTTKSSTPTLSVTNSYEPPAKASTLNDTTSGSYPSTLEGIVPAGNTSTGASTNTESSVTPTISNFALSNITSSSVRLTWKANVASDYTIQYGLSLTKLTTTETLAATGTSINVVLKNLPSGKHIYATITPVNGGTAGIAKNINFKTTSHNIVTPVVLILLFILVVIVVLIKLIGKKTISHNYSNDELPLPDSPPVIPQEDQATYNRRVNWWLPENMRQSGLPTTTKKNDEYPDMFEQGRERLEEEEKEHKLPKE
jgi:hypothetical protein